MAKPALRRVASDDCVITIDGEACSLHEGEWVEVRSGMTVEAIGSIHSLAAMAPKLAELEGEDGEAARRWAIMHDSFGEAIQLLSSRLVAWTWTDDDGEPLPQPRRNPDALRSLRLEEIYYLVAVVRGESPAEKKGDTAPSPITSSDSGPQPIPMTSSSARSRKRA